MPASQDILGWYGLASLAALALLIVAMNAAQPLGGTSGSLIPQDHT